ncbi:hypothetical protein BT63DRAFT_425087 [Microthyrium microscopicum]|uniref:DUF7514 domain-containing protein n=1 Tax=Microthyrium microscopicum TaxID=703497 RepID=A0A6A6UE45_9PEZI|nr:hypothetical protein BT63DRAFT_425087 [Microthyrium microscopicum]
MADSPLAGATAEATAAYQNGSNLSGHSSRSHGQPEPVRSTIPKASPAQGPMPPPTPPPNDAEEKEARHYWGDLFAQDKRCTETLDRLLTALCKYISANFYPNDHNDLTPPQLAAFYKAVGGDYDILFLKTPPNAIAYIYQSLGCLHSLQPEPANDGFSNPTVPALKARGFITWQTIQLLLGPEEHVPFLQSALAQFDVIDPDTGSPFPKLLPKACFPDRPDAQMTKWYEEVSDRLRREQEASTRRDAETHRGHQHAPKRDHTPDSSADDERQERNEAARYFSNPLYRDRAGRPAIVRQWSRPSPRSGIGFIQDRGRALAANVRHLWNPHLAPPSPSANNPNHARRRSWHADSSDIDDRDDRTPKGTSPARQPRRGRSLSSASSSGSENIDPKHTRPLPPRARLSPQDRPPRSASRTSPPIREPSATRRSSHNDAAIPPVPPIPVPSDEYFPRYASAASSRRHSSAHAPAPLGDAAGFAPSNAAPFAARVARLQSVSGSSSVVSGSGTERDRRRDRDRSTNGRPPERSGSGRDASTSQRDRDREREAREREVGMRYLRGTGSEAATRARAARDRDRDREYEERIKRSRSSDDRGRRDREREREDDRRRREKGRMGESQSVERRDRRMQKVSREEGSDERSRRRRSRVDPDLVGVDGRAYPNY